MSALQHGNYQVFLNNITAQRSSCCLEAFRLVLTGLACRALQRWRKIGPNSKPQQGMASLSTLRTCQSTCSYYIKTPGSAAEGVGLSTQPTAAPPPPRWGRVLGCFWCSFNIWGADRRGGEWSMPQWAGRQKEKRREGEWADIWMAFFHDCSKRMNWYSQWHRNGTVLL